MKTYSPPPLLCSRNTPAPEPGAELRFFLFFGHTLTPPAPPSLEPVAEAPSPRPAQPIRPRTVRLYSAAFGDSVLSAPQLSSRLGFDWRAVHKQLRRLHGLGLVERLPGPKTRFGLAGVRWRWTGAQAAAPIQP